MTLTLRRPSLGTLLGGLALLVAVGTGAASAAGSFVTIQDPTTSTNAKVSSGGKLLVGDGAGTLDVNAPRSQPDTMVRAFVEIFDSGCASLYAPPAGKGAVLTDITATTYRNASASTSYRLYLSPTSSPCGFNGFVEILNSGDPVLQTFGTGLVVPAGYTLWVNQFFSDGASTAASGVLAVTGYSVPASAAPAPPAAAATPGPKGSATSGD